MPPPNEYTGGVPPLDLDEHYRLPPEALLPPDQSRRSRDSEDNMASQMVRCRQGHVVDAGLSACPVCGDPIVKAGTGR
jgi:hypothetical protein